MKISQSILLLIGALLLIPLSAMSSTATAWHSAITDFIKQWEGFSALPFWDYKQWTWGYGTRVTGSINDKDIIPTGSITREQAIKYTINYLQSDYNYLSKKITIDLNPQQWAALLSFSYNLGKYNAVKLVYDINNKNWQALEKHWKKYIYAGGAINLDLVNRRSAEWSLFMS